MDLDLPVQFRPGRTQKRVRFNTLAGIRWIWTEKYEERSKKRKSLVSIPLRELDGFGLNMKTNKVMVVNGFNTLAGIRWIWT